VAQMGSAVAQYVEALRYKTEGRGFDSRWCLWNSGPTLALGSTQPLTEMRKSSPITGLEWPRGFQEVKVTSNRNAYREYLLRGKGSWCIGLTTSQHSCADCLEIWEP
jgi:hypothetical protein